MARKHTIICDDPNCGHTKELANAGDIPETWAQVTLTVPDANGRDTNLSISGSDFPQFSFCGGNLIGYFTFCSWECVRRGIEDLGPRVGLHLRAEVRFRPLGLPVFNTNKANKIK